MNKIEFPRTGVDGTERTKQEIEDFFYNNVFGPINQNLASVSASDSSEQLCLNIIKRNLKAIILASPQQLFKWSCQVDRIFNAKSISLFRTRNAKNQLTLTTFGAGILDAFNYKGFQKKGTLAELAYMLNVKSCPYCNMHYTLVIEEDLDKKQKRKLAKFQFDHFIDKSDYPMFSMSLYNLIPSCAICNNAKSIKKLSLDFHPYYSNVCELFTFKVHDPIGLYCGERIKDEIEIDIQQNGVNKNDLDDFIDTFHLKTLYQRHGDIAQETFDKAYEKEYYQQPSNFSWLSNSSPEYIQQLWMGVYPNEKDIEKRPMSKFIQDLWNQAKNIKTQINIEDTNE